MHLSTLNHQLSASFPRLPPRAAAGPPSRRGDVNWDALDVPLHLRLMRTAIS